MNKHRARIVLLTILAFSIFLILYRLGDLAKKVDDQEKSLDSALKNINSSISSLKKSRSALDNSGAENLTAEIIYEIENYNNDEDSVKVNFTVYPRQISENLSVSLASGDNVINLKRKGVAFKGSHVYKLNDIFLNLVTYSDGGVVKIDKLSSSSYQAPIGELIVPNIRIETKDIKSSFTDGVYNYQSVARYELNKSSAKILKDNSKDYIRFKNLDLLLEVNGLIRDTRKFEIDKADFNKSFNDIAFKYNADEKDSIKLYLKGIDDFGLEHIVILDQRNTEQEDSDDQKVLVYGKDKKTKLFEYNY